jgi:deoxycytidylate deaminase
MCQEIKIPPARRQLPYTPEGIEIRYTNIGNEHMRRARAVAHAQSLDKKHKTVAVIVSGERFPVHIVGANGSWVHRLGCLRKLFKVETGKKYWMCRGCQPHNHAEQKAIRKAEKYDISLEGASLYLWGHWWACKSCCDQMRRVGITTLYLEEGSDGVKQLSNEKK